MTPWRTIWSVAKRSAPAISPTSLAAVRGPKPASVSSCGATWPTSSAISRSSASIAWGELAQTPQFVARDANADRLLGARQPCQRAIRPSPPRQR